jgi:hypothetical protein
MDYSTGEGLILTIVRGLADFDAQNSSRADWKILNSGKSDHYAILKTLAPEMQWISPTSYHARYRTVIEVWQRYTDDFTTQTNLYSYWNTIVKGLQPYRYLNDTTDTIVDAGVSAGSEVQEAWVEMEAGRRLEWLRWDIYVDWQEQVTVTFAD